MTWREEFKHRLALALGWKSVAAMSREMTEREFRSWVRYAAKYLFPSDRQEAYLAQVASVIAQSVGNDMKISDFILEFGAKPGKAAKQSAGAIAAMLPGLGVRKLGQGRKKKAT